MMLERRVAGGEEEDEAPSDLTVLPYTALEIM